MTTVQLIIICLVIVATGAVVILVVRDAPAGREGPAGPVVQAPPMQTPTPAPVTPTQLPQQPTFTREDAQRLLATQPPSAPWEYDAVNNRYYHPGHKHYHTGQPPADRTVTTPTEGEFCPATNQYWSDAHGHFHNQAPGGG